GHGMYNARTPDPVDLAQTTRNVLILKSPSLDRIFRVALDTPMRRLFDYLGPPSPSLEPLPGARVRVPFGRQRLVGIVIQTAGASDMAAGRLKPIIEGLDPQPILDPPALGLLRWAAEYYHHPLGQAVATALPKALRLGASTSTTHRHWRVTTPGREAFEKGDPRRAPKQRKLLEVLAQPDGMSEDA